MRRRTAFTIVELLAVVAIIVVLLALLAPAMSRAVYHGQLTGCAAGLDALAAAITQYAAEHRRYYPYRDLPPSQTGVGNPEYVAPTELSRPVNTFEMRPYVRGLFDINKMLQCPLTAQVTLDPTPAGEWVFSSYAMWWGWLYQPSPTVRLPGLFRIGDRFEWANDSYDVLAGDWDVYGGSYVHSSHPDDARRMTLYVSENQMSAFGVPLTGSTWAMVDSPDRGLIDMNYAFTDGSVRRFPGVKPYLAATDRDDRMGAVPSSWKNVEPFKRAQVPRQ